MIVSGYGTLFNAISLFLNARKLKHKKGSVSDSTAGQNYKQIVIYIAMGDFLYSVSLLILGLADLHYQDEYLVNEYYWRKSFACYTVSILVIASNVMSSVGLNFMALSRYSVAKNPFDTKFLQTGFVLFFLTTVTLLSFLISAVLMVSYRLSSSNPMLPTGLCMLLANIDSSIATKLTIVIALLSNIGSCISIPTIYYHLNKILIASQNYREKMGIPSSLENDNKNVVVSSIPHAIIYFTQSLIFLVIASWKEYPYHIFIFAIIVVLPLNFIVNPFMFNKFNEQKDSKRKVL